jgi:FAD/FMN-containing dehydrogenase
MAATNAGGMRTVRYGNMGEQVVGLEVVLPDGSIMQRHSAVRQDNTGYDLASLFVGAEGTLGVITELDVRLHPTPRHRITAVAGFADLDGVVAAAAVFRELEGIAALELIDARALELTARHLGVVTPVEAPWLLLVEMAGDRDLSDRLADALGDVTLIGEPAVGVDAAAQQRLWRLREAIAEILGVHGPPLKFDVSLPLPAVAAFAQRSAALVAEHAADAIPVLFGHLGEGNLHLNVLRCTVDEQPLYAAMMDLIAACGGNVSSEHGVGSRKRDYLGMSRGPADIAVMRTIKAALDPAGYLNRAVLFG